MRARTTALLAVLMILPAVTADAQRAQEARAGRARVPLTIALVTTLPHPGAPFEIIRRPTGADRDVVLVTGGATAETLSDAIRGVLTARYASGDTAANATVLRVRPQTVDLRPVYPWATRVLADLQRAPLRSVDGVGTVRAVRIWLPAHRHRPARR